MSIGHVTAVVLAAGSGRRVGSDLPKQYLDLNGKPMIFRCLDVFEACAQIDSVVVALPAGDDSRRPDLSGFTKIVSLVAGGDSRQASLGNALAHLPEETDTVLVHDAARPLVDQPLIESLLAAVDGSDGAIPAIPLEDTVKRVSDDRVVTEEVDRAGIWRVQTPQAFGRTVLEDALAKAVESGLESTDCSQMVTSAGYRVSVVEGDPLNFKVTRAADLWLAEQILSARPEEG